MGRIGCAREIARQENVMILSVFILVFCRAKNMNVVLNKENWINSPETPILCFLHIPRTGGTTINLMLKYAFGNRAFFHAELVAEHGGEAGLATALANDNGIYGRAMLVTGHYGIAHPLLKYAPRPVGIAAVLRQPLERIVSLYDYIRGTPDHPEHAALSALTLNQALDTVPEFAAHCRDSQLRTLFNATDRHGITAALQRYPYLLGRMDALDVFAQRLLGSFGLTLGGVLPRFNERPVLAGVARARSQADYATALARLERQNRAELEFFARLPPIFATMPRPAMALARVSSVFPVHIRSRETY
jgi:hypothetical protein